MLDATIKAQLKAYLERLQRPIELVASLDDSTKAQELRGLLTVDQWRAVLKVRARASVLELAAAGGWPTVQKFLHFIKDAHDPDKLANELTLGMVGEARTLLLSP